MNFPSLNFRLRFCVLVVVECAFTLWGVSLWAASSEPTAASGAPIAPETRSVIVSTRREGDVTHFYVENDELCEITMTFEMHVDNLKASSPLPCTATFPPHQTTEAFSLSPIQPGAPWEYSYTNYYKLGSQCATHDDAYTYRLPYGPGRTFRVTQGYNGSFSHTGSNKYATDWKMPEGTPVYAARGGLVVKVRDSSSTGGGSMKFDPYNNFVLIRHDDGTLGQYCHLQKDGVVVHPGETISAGQLIAHSGNTGFSSGPHLHFCVYKAKNGRERESLPVRFKTADGSTVTLRTGRNYKAGPSESGLARSAGRETAHPSGG